MGVHWHWRRVCTESWLWEENSLPHRGIEPASVAWWSGALTNLATSHNLAMSGCQLAVLVSVSMILCSVSVRWLCLCQSHFFLFVSAWSPSVWISLCSPCVCQHGLVQCFSLMTMSVCQSHFFFLFVSAWSPSVWISLCSTCVCQPGLVQCVCQFNLPMFACHADVLFVCQPDFLLSVCRFDLPYVFQPDLVQHACQFDLPMSAHHPDFFFVCMFGQISFCLSSKVFFSA